MIGTGAPHCTLRQQRATWPQSRWGGDWDRRTALHIAAAEGNLAAVKVGG